MGDGTVHTTDASKQTDGGVVGRHSERRASRPQGTHEQPAIERHELPGTIPAGAYHEYFHDGRWRATDAPLGGGRLDWLGSDEWLAYDVDIRESGPYDLTLRVAAAEGFGGGHVGIVVDDDPLQRIEFGSTGDWGEVTTTVELPRGLHTLRLVVFEGGWTLERLAFR